MPPPPSQLRRPEGRAPAEDGSRGVLPAPAGFCGSRVLGLRPWPPPLPLSPNEEQGDWVKEPPSKEAPVLRLWVHVNVGGTSLDPAPCSSQFGFSQDLPRGAPLTGRDTGIAAGHSAGHPWGADHCATQLSPLPDARGGSVRMGLETASPQLSLAPGPRLLPVHSSSTKTWLDPTACRPQYWDISGQTTKKTGTQSHPSADRLHNDILSPKAPPDIPLDRVLHREG